MILPVTNGNKKNENEILNGTVQRAQFLYDSAAPYLSYSTDNSKEARSLIMVWLII